MGKGDKIYDSANKGIPREEYAWAQYVLGRSDSWDEADEDYSYSEEEQDQWDGLHAARLGVLRSIIPNGATPESFRSDAPPEKVQPLIDRADGIAQTLDDMEISELIDVQRDIGQLSLDVAFFTVEMDRLDTEMSGLSASVKDFGVPDGAIQKEQNDLKLLIAPAEDSVAVRPLTPEAVAAARSDVAALQKRHQAVLGAIATRMELRDLIRKHVPQGNNDATLVTDAPDELATPLVLKANALIDDVAKAEAAAFEGLRSDVGVLITDITALKDKVAGWKQRVEAAQLDLSAVKAPGDALGDEIKALAPLVEDSTSKLSERPFREASTKDAEDAVKAAQDKLKDIVKEAEARNTRNKALCSKIGVPDEDIADFASALGGYDVLADVAKTFAVDEFAEVDTAFGKNLKAAKLLGPLLNTFGGAAGLKALMAQMGGAPKLAALLDPGGKSPADIKAMVDGLGAGFVGALMGSGNDPTAAIDIFDGFGADLAKFTELAKDSGLGAKPKALAALFTGTCKGDVTAFKKFCTSFDDKTDRENLKGLVEDGGLGDAPDVLDATFAKGCAGDAAQIKALGKSFKSDEARKGLAQMLTVGGLDGSDKAIKPEMLGALLSNMSGEKPSGASDTDFAATRGDALAKLAASMSKDPNAANLKTTLKDGGLGAEPDVFAHMVGIGCGAGDATKVNGLTAELAKSTDSQKAMKAMLQQGGFGQSDDTGAPTGIDPRCLGHILEPGCNGKPDELVKLCKAMGPADLKNLKGVMTTGALGQNPKVLGRLYEHGCLSDPSGAHDGAKDPDVLKAMVGGFADATGPALFKDMLTTSGFTDAGHEDRLASVMRHAFTNTGAAPPTRDGAKLRKLANSFNGHFDDLETTMKAMEAAPDYVLERSTPPDGPNQPGKGLGNVIMKAPRYAGDPSRLHAEFFVPLKGRAGAGDTADEIDWATRFPGASPTRLDTETLLYTAASFEHQAVTQDEVVLPGPASGYKIDMKHVATRHTRAHGTFPVNSSPQMGTTLYPRGTTETEVADLAGRSLTGTDLTHNVFKGRPVDTPPKAARDFPGTHDYVKLKATIGGRAPPDLCEHQFGMEWRNPKVYISQFYPTDTCANLQKVNTVDFLTMNNVLKPDSGRKATTGLGPPPRRRRR